MEESKAVDYYNELTRKGEGAARFKQGLGFSSGSANDTVPARGSALSSSSSFLSSFVKASSPTRSSQLEKEAQLSSIQNKLKKKPTEPVQRKECRDSRVSERDSSETRSNRRSRSRSRERDSDRYSKRRVRSRSRDRDVERQHSRRRVRERSESPRRDRRRSDSSGGERDVAVKDRKMEGYDKMAPAERVKAKMKLQLAETSQKDSSIGTGSGWERFEFDKDAPLDDEEIEGADDDAAILKHVGQSFRFSAIEQRREEQVKAAHDEAMFGASTFQPSLTMADSKPEVENDETEKHKNTTPTSLLSEKVIAKQQGSWRDRARKT